MMAPDWASLGEPAELADVPPEVRQLVHEAPDKETVQAVAKDILSRVGDQTGELWSAIDDLLWDHHEPYHELPADDQKAWREAFAAELNGGYEPPHDGPVQGGRAVKLLLTFKTVDGATFREISPHRRG